MKCLKCNNDQFIEQKIRFAPEIKGSIIEVIVPCMICENCKEPLMNTKQMNVLRRASADKYKELHKLFTSSQIIVYREELGMSQAAFARYLNVGEASIKRWETYYVQDMSQNELIRLKCDKASAEMNFLDIYWKCHKPDIYSGHKKFNLQSFKNVVLYLVQHTKASMLYLNKFMFYNDFLHFKNYGISFTGVRYVPLKFGPCPDQYKLLYKALVSSGHLKKNKNHSYTALINADLSLFDDNEKATLESVYKLYQLLGSEELYNRSHKELGYTKTNECGFISYEFAKDLLI